MSSHCRNASTLQKVYQVLFGHNYPLPDYEGGNCPPTKHLPLNEPVAPPDVDTTGFGFGPSQGIPQTSNPNSHTDNHPSTVGGQPLEQVDHVDAEPVDPDQHQAIQYGHEEIANQIDWMLHDDEQYEDIANDLYQQSTYIPEGVREQLREGDEIDTPETYADYEAEHPTYGTNPYDHPAHDNVGVQIPLDTIESPQGQEQQTNNLPQPNNPQPTNNNPPVDNQNTGNQQGTSNTNQDTGITSTQTGSIYVYGYDGSTICRCPTWKTYGDQSNLVNY